MRSNHVSHSPAGKTRRARRWQGDYTRNYTKLSAPTSPPPIEEKFNPETIALMQQIRNLESRIKALETQPTFACG